MTENAPNGSTAASSPGEREALIRSGVGLLGMKLFLAALGVLFAASMAGYLAIRVRAERWPPPDAPDLPAGLWFSTLLIIAASVSIHQAVKRIRRDHRRGLQVSLVITFVLGLVFLALQSANWWTLYEDMKATPLPDHARLYPFTFYLLTVLHALHVLGGLVHLLIVIRHAGQGVYRSDSYGGVRYAAMYWHFLDVVWLVMFVMIYVAG